MANLYITQEEKEAPSYLDWDNETLGKAVRAAMTTIAQMKIPIENTLSHEFDTVIGVPAALLVIAGALEKQEKSKLVGEMKDIKYSGKQIGSWKFNIEKIED